jgi:hypothetical protein
MLCQRICFGNSVLKRATEKSNHLNFHKSLFIYKKVLVNKYYWIDQGTYAYSASMSPKFHYFRDVVMHSSVKNQVYFRGPAPLHLGHTAVQRAPHPLLYIRQHQQHTAMTYYLSRIGIGTCASAVWPSLYIQSRGKSQFPHHRNPPRPELAYRPAARVLASR